MSPRFVLRELPNNFPKLRPAGTFEQFPQNLCLENCQAIPLRFVLREWPSEFPKVCAYSIVERVPIILYLGIFCKCPRLLYLGNFLQIPMDFVLTEFSVNFHGACT